MKLIDLLVRELPKRGGWPKNANEVPESASVSWGAPPWGCNPMAFCMASHEIVTKEQYEAALAAAQQPVWDGDGLPPVGCECEGRFILGGEWFFFRCVAVDCGIAFGWAGKDAVTLDKGSYEFRPIPSEADKKRDEAIESIKAMLMYDYGDDPRLNDAVILYDAIAAGKIPHIRIE
ncbi:hypothetical protein PO816_000264 [Cronobacter dublinensis]|nr:hypothetical protein [Cronobacter dublinensis]